jgi:hypothetical protein
MFLQSHTMHADELRKRVSSSCVMSKSGTAEPLMTHPAGISNNAVDSLGGKEMMGTTERHARLDSRPHMANR